MEFRKRPTIIRLIKKQATKYLNGKEYFQQMEMMKQLLLHMEKMNLKPYAKSYLIQIINLII